jgi:hypothetical protein
MPHAETLVSLVPAGRATTPFSACSTPSWHHTEEMTRTIVLARANGMLRIAVFSAHSCGSWPRIVK